MLPLQRLITLELPACDLIFKSCNFKHQKFLLALITLLFNFTVVLSDKPQKKLKDFFSLSAEDIKGNLVNFENFRGKITLVINVATYCGFTRNHYPDLVKMQDILGSSGKFNVLAFPCNQFGEQEPDTNAEIQEFLRDIYKVNFPVFAKSEVVGDKANPVFQYLTKQSNQKPTWNFWKYLVDGNGKVTNVWAPDYPLDDIFPVVENLIRDNSRPRDEI